MYKRTVPRPRLRTTDRLFWAGLAKVWAGWRQALVIVSPATVLRWQRRRFRAYWTQLSGRATGGRPPVHAEIKAGVVGFAPLEGITSEEYHRIFDTNVRGLLLTTKAASPLFPETGESIVNVSSAVSSLTPPMLTLYSATKGAIDTITKSPAKELAPRKIRDQARRLARP